MLREDEVWDATYFSFVTLTTLGYGDFLPVTEAGRKIVIWQLFTTVELLFAILPLVIGRLADLSPTRFSDEDLDRLSDRVANKFQSESR